MYPCVLSRINGFSPFIFLLALIPAINPWHAASSYPEVPLIWPAMNNPFIPLYSNDNFKLDGSMQSYSIA